MGLYSKTNQSPLACGAATKSPGIRDLSITTGDDLAFYPKPQPHQWEDRYYCDTSQISRPKISEKADPKCASDA